MKIRTFTCFITFCREDSEQTIERKIKLAAEANQYIKKYVEEKGFEVQTTRVTTNSLEEYCDCEDEAKTIERIQHISDCVTSMTD